MEIRGRKEAKEKVQGVWNECDCKAKLGNILDNKKSGKRMVSEVYYHLGHPPKNKTAGLFLEGYRTRAGMDHERPLSGMGGEDSNTDKHRRLESVRVKQWCSFKGL